MSCCKVHEVSSKSEPIRICQDIFEGSSNYKPQIANLQKNKRPEHPLVQQRWVKSEGSFWSDARIRKIQLKLLCRWSDAEEKRIKNEYILLLNALTRKHVSSSKILVPKYCYAFKEFGPFSVELHLLCKQWNSPVHYRFILCTRLFKLYHQPCRSVPYIAVSAFDSDPFWNKFSVYSVDKIYV